MKTVSVSGPPSQSSINPRVDFDKDALEALIYQKGYDVIHEKSLQCPCKSRDSNQQSNCKNCGGCGWAFINSNETRMVIHSMNRDTKFKDWSEINKGTASITCLDREELSYMDRVTVKDANAIFGEVQHNRKSSTDKLFFFTSYDIKQILYIGLFISTDEPYQKLEVTTDYTFSGNKIILDDKYLTSDEDQDLSITIRYKHAPTFYIIDMPRETISSSVMAGGVEKNPVYLPIHAVAMRGQYIPDAENFIGNRMIDNSYNTNTCL